MKALSIRQPWAWLIAKGYKDIENRSWSTTFRGRIYIHASKRSDDDDETWLFIRDNVSLAVWQTISDMEFFDCMARGAIIGEVDIVNCLDISQAVNNPWAVGPWCFLLRNPILHPSPTPCRGHLALFEVNETTKRRLKYGN